MFTDARDISSTDENGEVISTENYNALLEQRGKEDLGENIDIATFEGEIEPGRTYEFGVDYNLGDIVEVENEYGISAAPRIIEIVECTDASGYSMVPTFDMDNIEISGPDVDAVFLTTAQQKVLATASGGVLVIPRASAAVDREIIYSNELSKVTTVSDDDSVILGVSGDFMSMTMGQFTKCFLNRLVYKSQKYYTSPYLRSSVSVYRYGNVVTLYYNSDSQNLPLGNVTLFTLDEEYRPYIGYIMMGCNYCDVQITIQSNGNVDAYNYSGAAQPNARNFRFAATYIGQDLS